MKAKEVLRRYANGERNFRGVSLRGCSFKGKDLSGADFSEADICSTNFTNTTLRGTNFSGAKAGLQRRWAIWLVVVSWLMALVSSFFCAFPSIIFLLPFSRDLGLKENGEIIYCFTFLIIILLYFYLIIRKGLVSGMGSFAIAVVGTGSVAVVAFAVAIIADFFAGTLAGTLATVGGFTFLVSLVAIFIVTLVFVIAGVVVIILAIILAMTRAIAGAVAVAVAGTVAFTFAVFFARVADFEAVARVGALTVTFAFCLLSAYIARRAINCDERDAWIRNFAIAFATTRGTSFRSADLTDANFTGAMLKSTDFRKAILIRTRWRDAIKLDRVRPGDSYINNRQVQQLVITGNGQSKDFSQLLNLTGINLQGANLINANFQGSDLSQANLQGANLTDANFIGANLNFVNLQDTNLSRAKLVQTQLSASDLRGATLTGAYIEDWGISNSTKLDKVNCDYIFLRLPTEQNLDPQRRPSDSKRNFQAGEFIKLTQKIANTVDLVFNNGIDWQVFIKTFQGLRVESNTGELPVIQTIENKGDGAFVIRVKVPEDVDEGKYERKFWHKYQPLLKEKDERIALLSRQTKSYSKQLEVIRKDNTKLIEIIGTMVEKENSQVNNITFNAPATGIAVNLEGDQNINVSAQKQNTTEAAAEIQQLLGQLTATYPTNTSKEKNIVVGEAVEKIEANPNLKAKVINALKEGGKETFREAINHPLVNILLATIEGWQDVE